jgi:hypothetical protein
MRSMLQGKYYSGIHLLKPRWPNPNPRTLALEEHDAKYSTGINDDCVRTIERMLVENLLPLYLQKLFGRNLLPLYLRNLFGKNGWCPSIAREDCGNWHGLQLIETEYTEHNPLAIITVTFRLGTELTEALSLPAGSLAKTLIEDSDCEHAYFFEDAHDTIELRISDRQILIDAFSLKQLETMQAHLETVMTALRMTNE